MKKKNVALTLGSGGARGLAHIGAIEELERRGYKITSLSGCSIGSLIAGIYASGKLEEARQWFSSLTRKQMLSLTDFSIGLSHLVKGDKVMEAIKEWVPDCLIEDLPIPVALVASDMTTSREVVFRSGWLFNAIRASISIPLCFEPVRVGNSLLVDGGLVNPLPLNRVERRDDDILIGINISAECTMETQWKLPGTPTILDKHGKLGKKAEKVWNTLSHALNKEIPPHINYLSMVMRTIDMQIQSNSRLMSDFMHPDIIVELPMDSYMVFDFDKAEEIIDHGERLMAEALDKYENS
ncbi:patatin-like phospholipase family protein [bacterium]|nr:patatin-like phospholipase family protein [bacterium]MBP5434687.1 patatin-like phospholipase family protein [bacterium]